jgi:hypothetical protein
MSLGVKEMWPRLERWWLCCKGGKTAEVVGKGGKGRKSGVGCVIQTLAEGYAFHFICELKYE